MDTYKDALNYLERFANYEKTRTVAYTPGTFDLARMEALLARVGNPHRQYSIVHVAGTKGKGSVCAMLEAVLRAAGYRTGLYTSPHLHSFCERIQVNGQLIPRQAVVALANEMAAPAEAIAGLTWFEMVTAMGLLYFAQQQVEIAIVEVGLGGRLDATNVVTPLVSVITSLSFDHTAWLGNTLAQIAAEKAGIIKPNVPAVSAPQPPDALRVIEQRCAAMNSPLVVVGRDWRFAPGEISSEGQHFLVIPPGQSRFDHAALEHVPMFVRLLGRHQVVNATVALATLAKLERLGLDIAPRHMRKGLATVTWPGRLEVLSHEPLVVCDGAHHGDSARQLVAALAEWFPNRHWTFIFGASSDKDFDAMFDALVPFARQIILTRSHHPRAADPEKLAGLVQARGGRAQIAADVAQALQVALQATDQPGIVATGSLFIAAETRLAWARRAGTPWPESDD